MKEWTAIRIERNMNRTSNTHKNPNKIKTKCLR